MSAEFDLEALRKAAAAPSGAEKKRQHHVWRHYKRQLMKGAPRISPHFHVLSKMSDICVPIMH
jgi:hypothetical protein